jgi:hypothetical protein
VFSVLGGKSWSEQQKGSSAKRTSEIESVEIVELRRYWILSLVLAMVTVKPVLRWICLASARNGMRWPWAMYGSITICSRDPIRKNDVKCEGSSPSVKKNR